MAKRRTMIICACIIVCIILVGLIQELFCHCATFDEERISFYFNEPYNSLDVVLIGSSDVYAGFASAEAYREGGFTSYPFCISATPVTMWKTMTEQALLNQKPEIIIVDPYGIVYGQDGRNSVSPRLQLIDTKRTLKERKELIKELFPKLTLMQKIEFSFPFFRFRTELINYSNNFKAYSEVKKGQISPLKGISTTTGVLSETMEQLVVDNAVQAPELESEEAFVEYLNYCNENNLNVLFVKFPTVIYSKEDFNYSANMMANYAGKLAEEYGYEYINLQEKFQEIGLNNTTDYYNLTHLNINGQKKVTDYLAAYLVNNGYVHARKQSLNNKNEWYKSIKYYDSFFRIVNEGITAGKNIHYYDSSDLRNKISKEINNGQLNKTA